MEFTLLTKSKSLNLNHTHVLKKAKFPEASFAVIAFALLIGIYESAHADCNLNIFNTQVLNIELGCSDPPGQTIPTIQGGTVLNGGQANGANSANVVVYNAINTLPVGGQEKNGIGVTIGGTGSANVAVTDTAIFNNKITHPSLGINIAVGPASGASEWQR